MTAEKTRRGVFREWDSRVLVVVWFFLDPITKLILECVPRAISHYHLCFNTSQWQAPSSPDPVLSKTIWKVSHPVDIHLLERRSRPSRNSRKHVERFWAVVHVTLPCTVERWVLATVEPEGGVGVCVCVRSLADPAAYLTVQYFGSTTAPPITTSNGTMEGVSVNQNKL